jgi:hypothetical protein
MRTWLALLAIVSAERRYAKIVARRMQRYAGNLNTQLAEVLPDGVRFEWADR